jgi:hypothetical protein
MMVETEGAITTKAKQQKIHHLRRFGFNAGGVSTKVLAVGRPMSISEVGFIQIENRGRSVSIRKYAQNIKESALHENYTRLKDRHGTEEDRTMPAAGVLRSDY